MSDARDEPSGLDAHCARILAEHGCASLSLAVARGDELVLTRAYGFADTAARRPATPETVYGLASVTKAFTATAVQLAAADGVLDLDSPVPAGPARAGAVTGAEAPEMPTARQLLCHRGGFPTYYDFHYDARRDPGPLPIDCDRYRALRRRPGAGFEYSNLGYRELGRLLEAATGRSLGDLLHERIAEPLGLTGFHFGPAPANPTPASPTPGSPTTGRPAVDGVAGRYTVDGRAYDLCHTNHPAAGAGWATAGDVALFARNVSSLLGSAAADPYDDALPINDRLGYGLGRIVSYGPGPEVHSHGGGMGGVAAMMVDVPEHELSVAVLTNSTGKGARDAVLDLLMAHLVPGFDRELVSPVTEFERPMALAEGAWAGAIDTAEGSVPLSVAVTAGQQVRLRLGDLPPVTVPATATDRCALRAVAPLQLPTADARLNSPSLGLELRLRDGDLTGRAIAFKNGDREGRLGSFLPHDCTLSPA
ncbi:beta-lactamase family protein [Streptomyces sp. XM4193]|uniref:serine hydrolase domain-containing protein n=1 Tax=Streptomyces sp. XM4193 TaxID=2929782 RepID=UPI001FF90116|nr:serine hydrolase domain-containing protein [Streptomyces sp. XM4193]MCK1796661.1 beta-lactamase family protein [Streptomyces sp. XM4193]